MATKKSSAPSGLTITRNGNKFVCEWKIPSAKYGDGQQFKATTVSSADISKTATKKTVEINLSQRYPAGKKLTAFSFSVRGNTDKKNDNQGWSDWSSKEFKLNPPRKPTVTVELTAPNACKFSWSVSDTGSSTHYPFKRVLIQSKLVKDCTWDPKDDDWNNAEEYTSTSASSSKTFTENSGDIANGNYTRLVRIIAQGCGGDSEPVYKKHVYGAPKQAEQTEGELNETSGGYDILVNWDTDYDKSTPIDESVIEWVMTAPNSDMSCPSGLSWNTGATIKDTSGKEAKHIRIDTRLAADQCLYTRVNTKHDSEITYGTPMLQKIGNLSTPTGLSVENVDRAQQTAKITATNASSVSGTLLEIIFRKNGSDSIVGTISGSPNYKTVKCPAWTDDDQISFAVRAVLPKTMGSYTSDGVTIYTIESYMSSEILWQTGSVAVAPGSLTLNKADNDVRASWTNRWEDANLIELSWSDNKNAWESTDEPNTFEINNPFITSWRIADLQTGKTWYVRVRSIYDSGDGKVYSPYSNMAEINLSSSPNVPTLALSEGMLAIGQGFTASWEYDSTDGTLQSEANLYEYVNGAYVQIGRSQTQEYIDMPGWNTAGTHLICVEVISASGQTSGKSSTVSITVAEPASCSTTNSLQSVTITEDDSSTRQAIVLASLPLTVQVTGAGTGGKSSVYIEREEPYKVDRPDGDDQRGFQGEVIFDETILGEGTITIGLEDLVGTLDDGAKYKLIAQVVDNVGQVAKEETSFEVRWSHQALIPSGSVHVDEEALVAVIKPEAPAGALATDRCDIYRLSSDKPVLIYKNATFGSKYVDPYPTIGENGGYRFVFITSNGDYNTAENILAMHDEEGNYLDTKVAIIDFGGNRVMLRYDLELSSEWDKDFEQRKYLGGSIEGYWKKGVERKGDISAISVPSYETDAIAVMRQLSEYEGECNVRTPEGSNYTANVSVSESWGKDDVGKIVRFTTRTTRIKPKNLDGMTYEEWIGGTA